MILLILVLVPVALAGGDERDVCDLDKDCGNGDSSMKRYYFNKCTRRCETFTYTGSGGNKNNFVYQFECERSCPGDLNLGDVCCLPAEPGIPGTNKTCLALIPRYFFNKKSGQCEKFIFGGCGGNHNNFATKAECERYCKKDTRPPTRDPCKMEPDVGPCKGNFSRFYYDAKTGTCKKFSYGGCCGNGNNFRTEKECLSTCHDRDICSLAPDSGRCYGYFKRYYYDKESHTCKTFVYGGCDGNKNNFETAKECLKTCFKKSCLEKPETGPCRAAMIKYYYDPLTRKCRKFTYGGCGGNGNRYQTERECRRNCAGIRIHEKCLLEKAEGTGKRCYRRFYFDRVLEKCLPFIYTGKGGNGNNFRTIRECRRVCAFHKFGPNILSLSLL